MRDIILQRTPAAWHRDLWREATPLGSGLVSALVYGMTAYETIVVNHAKLWRPGKVMDVPPIPGALEKTRKLYHEGKYEESNWAITDALEEAGFSASLGSPVPLCALRMDLGERGAFSHYRRRLDMSKAESVISWNEGSRALRRRSFVSRVDDRLYIAQDLGGGTADVTFQLSYHDTIEDDTKAMLAEMGQSFAWEAEGDTLTFSACTPEGLTFGAAARIVTDGTFGPGRRPHTLQICGASYFCVALQTFVGKPVPEALALCKADLAAWDGDFDAALSASAAIHNALYAKCDLRLGSEAETSNEELLLAAYEGEAPVELLEKLWRFGRYLMVCGTRVDGNPFPLYGLWHGTYEMMWPHNMANENVQMIYWHVLAGNMLHVLPALLTYYEAHRAQFMQNARNIFGLPGIYMPAGTTPGNAVPNQCVPVINNWVCTAAWLAQHFYDYYLYSHDETFLRERIVPYMIDAADFYEAFITYDENGKVFLCPSVSPENTPGSLKDAGRKSRPGSHTCPSVANSTLDMAILKEFFTNLIAACEVTGQHADRVPAWREILSRFPHYERTPDGDVREWMAPGLTESYNHRHLSHIYPVFPGREYVLGRDDPDWLAAFALSVQKRKLGAQSGWSAAHMASIYARFAMGEKAMTCLDNLTRSCLCNSLFTLHNDWRQMGMTMIHRDISSAPLQLDANMGIVNALQEMILFVAEGIIKLLPALPERLPTGSATNLRHMWGELDLAWDVPAGQLTCTIRAEVPMDVAIWLPAFVGDVQVTGGSYQNGRLILQRGESAVITSK